MKSQRLIIGYFHKCGDDDQHFQQVKEFGPDDCESQLLLQTENTAIVAYFTDLGEKKLGDLWASYLSTLNEISRPAFFDSVVSIGDPVEWAKDWVECFPSEFSKFLDIKK